MSVSHHAAGSAPESGHVTLTKIRSNALARHGRFHFHCDVANNSENAPCPRHSLTDVVTACHHHLPSALQQDGDV